MSRVSAHMIDRGCGPGKGDISMDSSIVWRNSELRHRMDSPMDERMPSGVDDLLSAVNMSCVFRVLCHRVRMRYNYLF